MIKTEKELMEKMKERYPDFKKIHYCDPIEYVEYNWGSGKTIKKIRFTTNKKAYDELQEEDNYVFFKKKDLYKWFSEYIIDLRDLTPKFNIGDIVYYRSYGDRCNIISMITNIIFSCDTIYYDTSYQNQIEEKLLLLKEKRG